MARASDLKLAANRAAKKRKDKANSKTKTKVLRVGFGGPVKPRKPGSLGRKAPSRKPNRSSKRATGRKARGK